MKISIELDENQSKRLQKFAATLGVDPKKVVEAAVDEFINGDADDFERAANKVLRKNEELYQRLSQ